MTFIILSLAAILSVIFATRSWAKALKIGVIIFTFAVAIGFIFLCPWIADKVGIRGISRGTNGTSNFSWLDGVMFLLMLAGMACKYFWDAIGTGNRIQFQKYQLIRPILISPIVFAVIWATMGDQPNGPANFFLAFQNGFFWQTIFNRRTKTDGLNMHGACVGTYGSVRDPRQ